MTDLEKKDSLLGSAIEGGKVIATDVVVKPLWYAARVVLEPTILETTESKLRERRKILGMSWNGRGRDLDEFDFPIIFGWIRTVVAGVIATAAPNPITTGLIAYYAAETAITHLRRIGWGRKHGAFQ